MRKYLIVFFLCFAANSETIVVLGSSTASGTGPTDKANAWVNRYKSYADSLYPTCNIIKLALGGLTTYSMLPTGTQVPSGRPAPDTARNITKAMQYNPSAIIINMPTNDVAYRYSMQEQLANYTTVLDYVRHAVLAKGNAAGSVPVWITTTQPRNFTETAKLQALMEMRDSTFARFGEKAIDFWSGLAQPNGWIKPIYNTDGIHMNDSAHAILFQRVVDARILESIMPTTFAALQRTEQPSVTPQVAVHVQGTTLAVSGYHTGTSTQLELFDTRGRRIQRLAFVGASNTVQTSVALSAQQVYFFRLHDNGKTVSGKVHR